MSFHVPVRRRRTRRRMKVEVRMWYVVETWRGGLKSLERTSRPSRKVESDQKAKTCLLWLEYREILGTSNHHTRTRVQ